MIDNAMELHGIIADFPGHAEFLLAFWSASVASDEFYILVFMIVLGTAIWLEKRRPCLKPPTETLKNSYLTNLSTFIFNDITLSLSSIPSLYYAAHWFGGHGLLSEMANGLPKFLLAFILLDFTLYVWHYATHHVDSLWIFHKVHHSDKVLNVTTGLRFHIGELFMEVLVRVAFIASMGIDADTVLFCQTIVTLFVLFHHTNITFPNEQVLSNVFIVPRLHRLHHSMLREEHDSNYGAVFSIWDRIFGSLKEHEPAAIGLKGVDEQHFLDLVFYGFTSRIQFKRKLPLVVARKRA